MKPFNLEKAKAGKPVCTRDGRPVRILCFDLKDNRFPIIAAVETDNREQYNVFTLDGKYYTTENSYLDLFMAAEKKTGWINIYKDNTDTITCSSVYSNKETAKKCKASNSYIDTIQITWEE